MAERAEEKPGATAGFGRGRWPLWSGPAGLLVAVSVAGLVSAAFAGPDERSDLPDPASFAISGLALALALVAVALVIARAYGAARPSDFGLRPSSLAAALTWAGALAVYYAVSVIYGLIAGPPPEQDAVRTFEGAGDQDAAWAAVFVVVLVAPWAEEFFFRGFFFGSLRARTGFLPAALFASAIFGLLHFSGDDTLLLVPQLAVLGFLFCLIYERTGSLHPAVAIHAINNALALVAATDVDLWLVGTAAAIAVGSCLIAGASQAYGSHNRHPPAVGGS